MTPPLPIGLRARRSLVGVAAVLACLLVAACATRQLEPDFATVSQAYADNLNWQMLLNLARLDQGNPAYFMVIGEVRISRTQSGGLGGSATSSRTSGQTVTNAVSRTVTNVLSGTLTPNVTANANPQFVFIPINGEQATRQLLEPIPIEVFNTLYQQGWPVDQLLRVLVERVEVEVEVDSSGAPHSTPTPGTPAMGAGETSKAGNGHHRPGDPARPSGENSGNAQGEPETQNTRKIVLSNSPTQNKVDTELDGQSAPVDNPDGGAGTPRETAAEKKNTLRIVLFNSPTRKGRDDNGESFARFLRTCEVIRAMQKEGGLSLAMEPNPKWDEYQKSHLESYRSSNSPTASDTTSSGTLGKPAGGGDAVQKKPAAPSGVEPPQVIYHFVTDPVKLIKVLYQFGLKKDDLQKCGLDLTSEAAQRDLQGVNCGDKTGDVSYNADGELERIAVVFQKQSLTVGTTSAKGPHASLILRSFNSVLDAVAQEQRAFNALHDYVFSKVPVDQRRPVLRTDWSEFNSKETLKAGNGLLRPVVDLHFNGKHYQITDPANGHALDLNSRWNRDVFRLLIDLSYQVTVDITKFQRQVLELSQ